MVTQVTNSGLLETLSYPCVCSSTCSESILIGVGRILVLSFFFILDFISERANTSRAGVGRRGRGKSPLPAGQGA